MKKTQINNNNLKNSNFKNSNIFTSLPVELNSILIGIMLGDGGMYRSSITSNARLEMSFGEKYKSFAESLGITFKNYISNPVKSIKIKGKDKIYLNYRLKTVSS